MNFTFYYLIFQLICIIYGLYLCFILIFGDNSQFPYFSGINPALSENPVFYIFTFQGPKRHPNDLEIYEHQFLEGTKRRSQGSARKEVREGFWWVPRGQIPWPCGTTSFIPRGSDAVRFRLRGFVLT